MLPKELKRRKEEKREDRVKHPGPIDRTADSALLSTLETMTLINLSKRYLKEKYSLKPLRDCSEWLL